MDCYLKMKQALTWYAGHQGDWQSTAKFLDQFFHRDPQRVIPVFETWPQWFHYPAMLYLRQDCGVEVWEVDSDDGNSRDVLIQMTKDEAPITITPLHKRDLRREERWLRYIIDGNWDRAVSNSPKRPHFIV